MSFQSSCCVILAVTVIGLNAAAEELRLRHIGHDEGPVRVLILSDGTLLSAGRRLRCWDTSSGLLQSASRVELKTPASSAVMLGEGRVLVFHEWVPEPEKSYSRIAGEFYRARILASLSLFDVAGDTLVDQAPIGFGHGRAWRDQRWRTMTFPVSGSLVDVAGSVFLVSDEVHGGELHFWPVSVVEDRIAVGKGVRCKAFEADENDIDFARNVAVSAAVIVVRCDRGGISAISPASKEVAWCHPSPDGECLALCGTAEQDAPAWIACFKDQDAVCVYSIDSSGQCTRTQTHEEVTASQITDAVPMKGEVIAVSRRGNLSVIDADGRVVASHDYDYSGSPELVVPQTVGDCVAFTMYDERLGIVSQDGSVLLGEAKDDGLLFASSDEGGSVLISSDSAVSVYGIEVSRNVLVGTRLPGVTPGALAIDVSGDGRHFAFAYQDNLLVTTKDGTEVWRTSIPSELSAIDCRIRLVNPDSVLLASRAGIIGSARRERGYEAAALPARLVAAEFWHLNLPAPTTRWPAWGVSRSGIVATAAPDRWVPSYSLYSPVPAGITSDIQQLPRLTTDEVTENDLLPAVFDLEAEGAYVFQDFIPAELMLSSSAVAANADRVAIGFDDGTIHQYSRNGELPLEIRQSEHLRPIVSYAPSGSCLVAWSWEQGSFTVFDTHLGEKRFEGSTTAEQIRDILVCERGGIVICIVIGSSGEVDMVPLEKSAR